MLQNIARVISYTKFICLLFHIIHLIFLLFFVRAMISKYWTKLSWNFSQLIVVGGFSFEWIVCCCVSNFWQTRFSQVVSTSNFLDKSLCYAVYLNLFLHTNVRIYIFFKKSLTIGFLFFPIWKLYSTVQYLSLLVSLGTLSCMV